MIVDLNDSSIVVPNISSIIVEKYLYKLLDGKAIDYTTRVQEIVDRIHTFVNGFPDCRKVFGMNITIGDIKKREDRELLYCGFGMYFLFRKQIVIYVNNRKWTFGYDNGDSKIEIKI